MPGYASDTLCKYHNMDGDLRGWSRKDYPPEVHCPACRGSLAVSRDAAAAYAAAEAASMAIPTFVQKIGRAQVAYYCVDGAFSEYSRTFRVELVSGKWPKDTNKLLAACPDYVPEFGGSVKISEEGVPQEIWVARD